MAYGDFLAELQWRGLVHGNLMPGTEEHLAAGKRIGYIGFDPTAESMTIGNYVQIMLLTFFQRAGHQPIMLLGGATGRVGDPSGKDKERQLKTLAELDKNIAKFELQARNLLNFDGENGAILINNLHFYQKMNVLEFLRDVGKHITVNYMMAKDSVKNRIERDGEGLSFTEFSYQLLQGYDFNALFSSKNCTIQMGGSDQFGNITTGVELTRRISGGKVYAVVTPLLTKADGEKFGKTSEGNIWLDASMTSPYKFYQFWINSDDADIPKFLRYFSLKSRSEIENLEKNEDIQRQKRLLGEELTRRIHGDENFERVLRVSEILFGGKMSAENLAGMDLSFFEMLAGEIPNPEISKSALQNGLGILDFLSKNGMAESNSEARNAIKGNAVSINKVKISNPAEQITIKNLLRDRFIFVENGKKNKFLVKVSD